MANDVLRLASCLLCLFALNVSAGVIPPKLTPNAVHRVVPGAGIQDISNHHLHHLNLTARQFSSPATDDEWHTFRCAGERLYNFMRGTADDVEAYAQQRGFAPGQTPWTYDQLGPYGWTNFDDEMEFFNANPSGRVAGYIRPEVLEGLGLKPDSNFRQYGGSIEYVKWEQFGPFTPPGGTRQSATNADYTNWYDASQNTIWVDATQSPKSREPSFNVKGPYSWAEVTFLEWQHQCQLAGTDTAALKYIFRVSVVNGPSGKVIGRILANHGTTLNQMAGDDRWASRITIPAHTDEGLALLGTPNGSGVAWLLARNKDKIGNRIVTEVILYAGYPGFNGVNPNLVLVIGDAAGSPSPDPPSED